ncbi:hypothetical protein BTN49_0470 [Candidatus Enterovibrio escicola]|uniref:Uncharacterized protein n=1 Tax=Candidatus Enterovibrio escicola TaxID=1927127 RepID=A0A2A5T5S3_9GAMM|nr:hypothetical protein BTN49_0470 [Candidatus Enterovibrio escacola]
MEDRVDKNKCCDKEKVLHDEPCILEQVLLEGFTSVTTE